MVTVSESAAGKIRELLDREDRLDYGLRMKVVGGGCSGLQYEMDFYSQSSSRDARTYLVAVRPLFFEK